MIQYFPKRYQRSDVNVKVEFNLSNYATKADLKGVAGVDKSNLAAKLDIACLNSEVDKIDIDKLKIFLLIYVS